METKYERNIATLTHLSTLTQYFIPFGSFIFPILLWSSKRDSAFVSQNGRNVINFQLSMLLYYVILILTAAFIVIGFAINEINWEFSTNELITMNVETIRKLTGLGLIAGFAIVLTGLLKIAEFFLIIVAAVAASEGKIYKYPLTINFIRTSLFDAAAPSQSANTSVE